jgi:hypothetical protein
MLFAELDVPAVMALSIPLFGISVAVFSVLAYQLATGKSGRVSRCNDSEHAGSQLHVT